MKLVTLAHHTKKLLPTTAFFIALLSTTVLPILMNPPAEAAGTDTYPTSIGGCRAVSGNPSGSFTCDLKGSTQDEYYDPWGEENRECVSYAAWMLSSVNGFTMPFYADAVNWGPKAQALGYTVDTSPKPGSIFWDSAHDHVGWVESVSTDGSSVTYEDYNSSLNGLWGEHTVATSSAKYIHFKDLSGSGGSGGGSGPSMPYAKNLVSNSGFNSSSNFNHWNIYPGTNYANYTASSGITPFEGDQYLATNAYQTGGSIYQDIPATTSAGQDYCFSVMLTTADPSSSGGSGSIALLNMNSGTVIDAGATNFSGLPNNSQWQRTEVCTPTTGAGNNLRVQIYPSVNGKTIGVDAATLNLDAAANGGFEQGSGSWSVTQNTNYANYGANNPSAGGAQPYEGSHFEATNAYGAQASIYQDIAISLSNGNEYCVNAMLTTADGSGASGGFGDLNLYAMNGGNVVSAAGTHFSNLPNNNQWVPVNTCVYMTGSGNTLRVQLYPGYGSPTLGVDAVNVNQDLVANGGFEAGTGWWSTYPGTNFTTYAANNGLTGGTNPPEGSNFGATNTYQSGGSIYQDIAIPTSAGQTYCVTAQLTTADQSGTTGGSGSLNLFNLNNGNVVNVGSTNFSNLPNNNQWRQVETCVDITGAGNDLRVQLYPTVNGKTLGVDAVNVL